ncbi:MAG: T9SS type A sorting domain-containing protein [Bacteroidetes bacterium]|nr:T9SS type A sorting domain-containing protein [Bacteroidota bacterium]
MNSSILKKLKAYSLAAGSLTAVSALQGQIVYTDINPDVSLNGPSNYNLDMDNNGQPELQFFFYSLVDSVSSVSMIYQVVFDNTATLGNLFQSYIAFPTPLNNGDSISPAATDWRDSSYFQGAQYLAVYNTYLNQSVSFGNWLGSTDKYVGIRFNINNQPHYGWIRLTIGATANQLVVKDFAYRTSPGVGLTAGQTTVVGVAEQSAGIPSIHIYDRTLFVNLPAETTTGGMLQVFSASGQIVHTESITDPSMRIALGDLATGMYMVQIIQPDGSVVSRKVYL